MLVRSQGGSVALDATLFLRRPLGGCLLLRSCPEEYSLLNFSLVGLKAQSTPLMHIRGRPDDTWPHRQTDRQSAQVSALWSGPLAQVLVEQEHNQWFEDEGRQREELWTSFVFEFLERSCGC